jgi:hypothetical protein
VRVTEPLELLAQGDEAAPQPGLDGAEWEAGFFGDFWVGEAVVEEEVEELAGVCRQGGEAGSRDRTRRSALPVWLAG